VNALEQTLIGYWPLFYPFAAAALLALVALARRAGERRLRRARRALSDYEIARAGRPSPAPIDVEPLR
jgi:hypothetical protein